MRQLLLLIAAALVCGCSTCKNHPVSTVRSPDAQWDAITFQRDCGTGVKDSTQVSVVKAKKPLPKASGNAFVSDTAQGKAAPEKWGGPKAEASWTPEGTLKVSYDPAARVYACAQKVGTVAVQCAPAP